MKVADRSDPISAPANNLRFSLRCYPSHSNDGKIGLPEKFLKPLDPPGWNPCFGNGRIDMPEEQKDRQRGAKGMEIFYLMNAQSVGNGRDRILNPDLDPMGFQPKEDLEISVDPQDPAGCTDFVKESTKSGKEWIGSFFSHSFDA
jgi:hypothetical protein